MSDLIIKKIEDLQTENNTALEMKASKESVSLLEKANSEEMTKIKSSLDAKDSKIADLETQIKTIETVLISKSTVKADKQEDKALSDYATDCAIKMIKNPSVQTSVKSEPEYQKLSAEVCDGITEVYSKQYDEVLKNKPLDALRLKGNLSKIKAYYDSAISGDGGMFLPKPVITSVIQQIFRSTDILKYIPTTIVTENRVEHVFREGVPTFSKVYDLAADNVGGEKSVQFVSEFLDLQLYQDTINVSSEMISNRSQFEIDVVGGIFSAFAEGYGLLKEGLIINGTGQKEAKGILGGYDKYAVTAPHSYSRGKVGYLETAGTGALTSVDIVNLLVKTLPTVHRGNAVLLMNSNTNGMIQTFVDAATRPSFFDNNSPLGSGIADQIKRYPIVISESMPDVASGNYPIIFGDLSAAYSLYETPGLQTKIIGNSQNTNFVSKIQAFSKLVGGIKNFQALRLLKIK